MKPLKGLYLDSGLYDVPQGYVVMARNAINDYVSGSITKEKGFVKIDELPYTNVGTIETPEETFIFSTDGTFSAISRLKDNQLTTVIDDRYKLFKFNFSPSFPIKGCAIKNYKSQWIIAWIDELNPLRILNVDEPSIKVETDLSLFPQYNAPSLYSYVQSGGSLTKGTYIAGVRYVDNEGTYTDFIQVGKPMYVGNDKSIVTDKSIIFNLRNLDTRYSYYQLGFEFISKGVTTFVVTSKQKLAVNSSFVLSDNSQLDSISNSEFLINSPYYIQAKGITEHKNRLVIANVTENDEINYQAYANNIKIRAKSTLVTNMIDTSTNCKGTSTNALLQSNYGDGNIKTFIHGEVYAFYIALVLNTGRRTKAFHIPGRKPNNSELNVSAFDNCYKRYQIENTAFYDPSDGLYTLGAWINQDEKYPDTFGELANLPVRHHVMPTIKYCLDSEHYKTPEYGINVLDVLGIKIDNVIIPDDLVGQVIGYEIYYAKRTQENQTFIGQSISLLGTHKVNKNLTSLNNPDDYITDTISQSTGGNWNMKWAGTSDDVYVTNKILRMHTFDQLQFKPALGNCSITNQIKLMSKKNTTASSQLQNDSTQFDKIIDYTLKDNTLRFEPSDSDYYRSALSFTYLPSQALTDKYDNRGLESCFAIELNKGLDNIDRLKTYVRDVNNKVLFFNEQTYDEETYLTNVISPKSNVYVSFYDQTLIYTGFLLTGINTDILYCGDGFICDYSFVTYGLRESNDFNKVEGNRFIHRFLCESNTNITLRYQDEGNIQSNFYPKSSAEFLKNLDRSLDANQFLYDSEFNKTYDISKVVPYNPYDNPVVLHTNRGIVSAEEQKEKGPRSWRTFYALDYFEVSKSKGVIVDVASQDEKLIVRTEHTVYVSEGLRTLGSEETIYLKTVSLVDQQFVDVFSDSVGIIGSKNKFSSYKCPMGYVIIDEMEKNIYIYKDGIKNLNNGLNRFFKDNLITDSDNPFIYSGFVMGYDSQYKRLLLTQKGRNGFTLSYSLTADNWVSFHDYQPQSYIRQHGTNKFYSIHDNNLYQHHVGKYGDYYDGVIRAFYVDVPFIYRKESGDLEQFVLDNVRWITTTNEELKTFTHITVYNSLQCTKRTGLFYQDYTKFNCRKYKGEFWFDKLRDETLKRNSIFLDTTLKFKEIIDNQFGNKDWYRKELLTDKVAVVRLEDNNASNSDLLFQNISISLTPAMR